VHSLQRSLAITDNPARDTNKRVELPRVERFDPGKSTIVLGHLLSLIHRPPILLTRRLGDQSRPFTLASPVFRNDA
jgi:hypothetical protein